MGVAFSFRHEADYLYVKVTGQWSTEAFQHVMANIRAEVSRGGQTRLLVDVSEMLAPLDQMTRFHIGEAWAKTFGSRVKAAFVSRPEVHNRFAENVAYNRGANVAVFLQETDALQWLLAHPTQAAAAIAPAPQRQS